RNSSKHVPRSQDYSGNTIPRLIERRPLDGGVRCWIVDQAPPTKMAFCKENDMKRFGVLLASAALGAAVAATGPALAFGGGHGGGFGRGHGGGFGRGPMGG